MQRPRNEGGKSASQSPTKDIGKERIIENPDLAMNWLNNKQADKE